jgi:hypothetical protein
MICHMHELRTRIDTAYKQRSHARRSPGHNWHITDRHPSRTPMQTRKTKNTAITPQHSKKRKKERTKEMRDLRKSKFAS